MRVLTTATAPLDTATDVAVREANADITLHRVLARDGEGETSRIPHQDNEFNTLVQSNSVAEVS